VNIGIVGFGNRGSAFARQLEKYSEVAVTALCDPNDVRMRKTAKTIKGEQRFYGTINDMLASEELDAVIITSPDHCHESNAVMALQKDIFVLIDKPLATTAKGCKNIIKASEKSKATVMMGFNLRHDPVLMQVKEIVARGDLGRIFMIENREFYDGGKTYLGRWNRKYEYGGGLWVHKGSHDFDIFNWLNTGGKPLRVAAFAERSALRQEDLPFKEEPGKTVGPTCYKCDYKDICPDCKTWDQELWGEEAQAVDGYAKGLCIFTSDADVHDNGIAIVEYDNGVRASHMECFVTSQTDRLYTVVGTKGQLTASLHNRKIEIRPRWSEKSTVIDVPEVKGGHGGADTGIVDHFIKLVKGEEKPSSALIDGTMSVAIGDAAEHSWREHRMVDIAEVFET